MTMIAIFGDIRIDDIDIEVSAQLKQLCSGSVYGIANLEGPVKQAGQPRLDKMGVAHWNSPKISQLLKDLSVNVLTLGNNHVYDYGNPGLVETAQFCDAHDIKHLGARLPNGMGSSRILLDDVGLAFYSYAHQEGPMAAEDDGACGPFRLPETDTFADEISKLKKDGWRVIVSYHGGEEYFNHPWPRRLGWCKRMSDSGADLVLGCHSHSVQPIYTNGGSRYIAPGLGNTYFISKGQAANLVARRGLLLLYDLSSGNLKTVVIKSNVERNTLVLDDQELRYSDLMSPHHIEWRSECFRSLCGRLNRRPNPVWPQWKRTVAPYYIAFRNLQQSLEFDRLNLRDQDIRTSIIPHFGHKAIDRMYREGYERFMF